MKSRRFLLLLVCAALACLHVDDTLRSVHASAMPDRKDRQIADLQKDLQTANARIEKLAAALKDCRAQLNPAPPPPLPPAPPFVDMKRTVFLDDPNTFWIYADNIDPDDTGKYARPDLFKAFITAHVPADAEALVFIDLENSWNGHGPNIIEESKIIEDAKALRPRARFAFYGRPFGCYDCFDARWKANAMAMAPLFKRGGMVAPSLYRGYSSAHMAGFNDPEIHHRFIDAIVDVCLEAGDGVPVVMVYSTRYFGGPFSSNPDTGSLIPDDEVIDDVTRMFSRTRTVGAFTDRADAIIHWNRKAIDEYFWRMGTMADITTSANSLDVQKWSRAAFAKEIPAGVLPAVYLQWLQDRADCLLKRAALGDGCTMPLKPRVEAPTPPPVSPTPPVVPPAATQPASTSCPITIRKMDDGRAIVSNVSANSEAIYDAGDVKVPILEAVAAAWGATNMDDILQVVNALPGDIVVSTSASLNALKYVTNGQTLEGKIIYCPDDKIAGGVSVDNGAKCTIRNVLVIGSWQALYAGENADVTLDRFRAVRSQTWTLAHPENGPMGHGDQGGYGGYSIAAKIMFMGRCVFACRSDGGDHDSTQYAWRSSGTTLTTADGGRAVFYGSKRKDFTSRMTGSTGNALANCEWHGNTPSFGGGSAGPGIGQFSGEIRQPTFDLWGASKATAQPGVDGLKFVGPIKTNKADWLSIDSAAKNVTVVMP